MFSIVPALTFTLILHLLWQYRTAHCKLAIESSQGVVPVFKVVNVRRYKAGEADSGRTARYDATGRYSHVIASARRHNV